MKVGAWAFVAAITVLLIGCSSGSPASVDTPGKEHQSVTASSSAPNGDNVLRQNEEGMAEKPAPSLQSRPDALVMVSFGRNSQEVYGYNIATGRLDALTIGAVPDSPMMAAFSLALSTDGEKFAYVRHNGDNGTYGVCVRSTQGGEAQCVWERLGDVVSWRPGAHEFWVTGGRHGESWAIFDISGGELSKKPGVTLPQGHWYSFSPDGKSFVFSDAKGTWIGAAATPGSPPRRILDEGRWLDSSRMVITTDKKIGVLNTADTFIELPKPEVKGREVFADAFISPTGRYLSLSFGLPGAVFRYSGESAVYNLQLETWRRTQGTIVGWTGDGRFCVVSTQAGYSLMSPESLEQVRLKADINGFFVNASPDGDWLVFDSGDTLTLYQISTSRVSVLKPDAGKPVSFIWVPKGPR